MVDWLLTHGADPQLADRAGDTALHYAVLGARWVASQSETSCWSRDLSSDQWHGRSEPILALVNKGAEVDTVNNEKRTALHLAVLNRKPDIVATLVKVSSLELNELSFTKFEVSLSQRKPILGSSPCWK